MFEPIRAKSSILYAFASPIAFYLVPGARLLVFIYLVVLRLRYWGHITESIHQQYPLVPRSILFVHVSTSTFIFFLRPSLSFTYYFVLARLATLYHPPFVRQPLACFCFYDYPPSTVQLPLLM